MITEEQISELLDGMVFERGSFPRAIGIVQGWLADAWDSGFRDGGRQEAEGDDGPRFVNPYL